MAGALLQWVGCQPPPIQPQPWATGYMGRSWGWCAELACPRPGDSLFLSLTKTLMGFWVQVSKWVTPSSKDLLGWLQGCRDGDAQGCRDGDVQGWPSRVLPVLLLGRCCLPRGLKENQIQDPL